MTGATTTETGGAGQAVPLVGKKYLAKLGSMVNESAAGEMSLFARKQMEKMGWSQGKGLGKEEQGMATYVRVKKREEAMGIGVETLKVEEQQNQWWYNAYDKLADKIKIATDSDDGEKKSKKSKKKDKKKQSKKRARDGDSGSDSDSVSAKIQIKKFRVPTDEELFAATGGKLFGRRAYGSCNGKLKRDALLIKEQLKTASDKSRGDSASTSSADESSSKKDKKQKKESKKSKKKEKKHADED